MGCIKAILVHSPRLNHQSGHKSRSALPSSSGESCCFIHRSGTCSLRYEKTQCISKRNTYQWKIAFHRAEEPLPILFGGNDGWLSLGTASKECRVLNPAFQLLVPGVCTDIIYDFYQRAVCLRGVPHPPTIPTTSSLFALSTPTTSE